MSSDHEADVEHAPWMCTEVDVTAKHYRSQILFLIVAAFAAGIVFTTGWIGVWFGLVWLWFAAVWARSEMRDACEDAAWEQRCHEVENR